MNSHMLGSTLTFTSHVAHTGDRVLVMIDAACLRSPSGARVAWEYVHLAARITTFKEMQVMTEY